MEKIIFLDIDGVLNSLKWNDNHEKEISEGILIDNKAVKLLADLIRETNAKVVLHSGWRFWFDENKKPAPREAQILQRMLVNAGIYLYDFTPDLSTAKIKKDKTFSLTKAGEILAWLSQHKEVTNWVVLDDLDLHNEEIEKHQVRTDAGVGLTKEDIEKAIAFLR